MKRRGIKCRDIRQREVGSKKTGHAEAVLKERVYQSSGGTEYFLSFESPDEDTIYGFVRLRISDGNHRDGHFSTFSFSTDVEDMYTLFSQLAIKPL